MRQNWRQIVLVKFPVTHQRKEVMMNPKELSVFLKLDIGVKFIVIVFVVASFLCERKCSNPLRVVKIVVKIITSVQTLLLLP